MPTTDVIAYRATPRRAAGRASILLVALALLLGLAPAAVAGASSPDSPPPGGDRPVWEMPTSGDLIAAFNRSDFDEQDGTAQNVDAPSAPGQRALQFQLEPGDQRSELRPQIPYQREGQVQWYTYSASLANDFPVDIESWQLVLQWHHEADTGSPPIAVEVRNGRLEVAAEGAQFQDLGPIAGGDRIDLTMRIHFSQDPNIGTVDVWRDGNHLLQGFRPENGTLLDEYNYVKVGYYRDDSIDQFGRFWLEDMRAGPTLESVRGPEDSPSAEIPRTEDPQATPAPAAPVEDTGTDVLTWIGGALLVLLIAGVAVYALRRRRVDH